VAEGSEGALAVDGKTAKQGLDRDGNPLHMLNAFVHDVQAVVVNGLLGTTKRMSQRCFAGSCEGSPILQLIAGDAMFAQRPLINMKRNLGKDYLFQVKGNHGDTLDVLGHCFGKAAESPPTAQMTEKRGFCTSGVVYGGI